MKTLARILFGLPFGVFGFVHLFNAHAMVGFVPPFIPGGVLWVYVTGVLLLASSLAIIAGKYVFEAGVALACLMGIFVLTIHVPGVLDPAKIVMAMPNLLKDTALGGAALTIALYHRGGGA